MLNGGHWVSPAAREAVEQAIETLGYRANPHARSLVTGRSNSVAFLLNEPQHLLFDDPTFAVLLRGVAQALSPRDITLVLLVASTPAERARVLHYLGAGHVDGAMLISAHEDDPLVAALADLEIPCVMCGLPLGAAAGLASVAVDEVAGAREMVRHLWEGGRHRIAHIAGPQDTPGGRFRLEGYLAEMACFGATPMVAVGDYSRASGVAAMEALLAEHGEVDAVFAASDLMAAGALTVLRQREIAVPDEVALGGFDDSGLASTLEPPLTTIAQPFGDISAAMVDLLAEVMEGAAPRALTFPPRLVSRESTSALRVPLAH